MEVSLAETRDLESREDGNDPREVSFELRGLELREDGKDPREVSLPVSR